ncbi:MAG: cysteine desulfurase-like protein [Hyphomicrobiales bacterium]|nr:cysteine desulfurase-like protein [Hyphomicrobiales bacterium]
MLDLTSVRARFPALADGFVYLDNAGGSLVLRDVAERVSEYLLTTSVQTGASYSHSMRASERLAQSRASIARFVNASWPEEIVLGPTTSALMRLLATAMAPQFSPGDEVIVTVFDHESNIGPWHILQERGVVFRVWTINPDTFRVDLDDLRQLMSKRTRLVAVTHASNILGTINPIAEIAAIVHAGGAKLAVDAVAYAPHRAVDVQASGADFYAFSFYKTFGPHFAMLWGRYDLLAELESQYHYFYTKDKVPTKLEPGNANYELAWGCTGIVDYFDGLGGGTGDRVAIVRAFDAVADHEAVLGERLLGWLRDRNDVRIIGDRHAPKESRVPTIAFKFDGRRSDEIVRCVDADRIGIRHGDFHSRRLVEHLGLADGGGVLRVSMVHYNTIEEVDRLTASLERALAG